MSYLAACYSVAHLAGGEDFVVVEDGPPLVLAVGEVLGGEEEVDALHGQRGAGVERHDSRMRTLAQHEPQVQLVVVAGDVVAVNRLACSTYITITNVTFTYRVTTLF